jgi:hypothetical protein
MLKLPGSIPRRRAIVSTEYGIPVVPNRNT